MATSTYPVRVDGALDPHLNRWLWLVKWALVIPHYVVLAFLWVAFLVLSVVAFFAILFAGRYPRSIFDFNVGVLRWSWRVAYYAYGALGTDRYPPFSLGEQADYPAHLEIDYPDRLSRGLVLVKWWLLAIPHYLVVGLFLGGGLYAVDRAAATSDGVPWLWGGGLIGLLVLIAAVVLLFTSRYPRDLFDLVLGMNRWVLRVAGYAALMTDAYPPFRLDMGPDDPASAHLTLTHPLSDAPTPGAPDTGGPPTPATSHRPSEAAERRTAVGAPASSRQWTAGRIVAVTLGSFLLMVSGGLLAGGVAMVVADQAMRDDAGFVATGQETFATTGYAVTTESIELHVSNGASWLPESLLGDTRLTADGDKPVFLGIAPTADVDRYLDGVRHATVTDYTENGGFGGTPVYRDHPGTGQPPQAPGDLDIWAARASGTGEQSLTWTPTNGDWTVVLMNSDATSGVTAGVSAAAQFPILDWAIPVVLVLGVCLLLLSLALVAGALLGGRTSTTAP